MGCDSAKKEATPKGDLLVLARWHFRESVGRDWAARPVLQNSL